METPGPSPAASEFATKRVGVAVREGLKLGVSVGTTPAAPTAPERSGVPMKKGLCQWPTEEACSKVLAVSDLILILDSKPSPKRFLPASGNSSEANETSVPLVFILLSTAIRRCLDSRADELPTSLMPLHTVDPSSDIWAYDRVTFEPGFSSAKKP